MSPNTIQLQIQSSQEKFQINTAFRYINAYSTNSARLLGMTADEGLECLVYMIDTQSLAGTFYLNEIDGHIRTLEESFEKLLELSLHNSNHTVFPREWRNQKVFSF